MIFVLHDVSTLLGVPLPDPLFVHIEPELWLIVVWRIELGTLESQA